MLIVFTLKELGHHSYSIVANRVILACTIIEIKGRVMRDIVEYLNNTNTYLVNAAKEEYIVDSILTESKLMKTSRGKTMMLPEITRHSKYTLPL